jgi:isopenicillin N synthase-like dioxygenase
MEDGSWLDVTPRKDSLIVNIGAILSKMSDERLKATVHRVLAIGRPRRSTVFFYEPSYHAFLPNRLPSEKTMKSAADYPRDDSFEYGPFMKDFIQRFVELKGVFDPYENRAQIEQ